MCNAETILSAKQTAAHQASTPCTLNALELSSSNTRIGRFRELRPYAGRRPDRRSGRRKGRVLLVLAHGYLGERAEGPASAPASHVAFVIEAALHAEWPPQLDHERRDRAPSRRSS